MASQEQRSRSRAGRLGKVDRNRLRHTEDRQRERRTQRNRLQDGNRDMEPPAPQPPAPPQQEVPPVRESRLEMLRKWQARREQERQLQGARPRKKPFRVGAVAHSMAEGGYLCEPKKRHTTQPAQRPVARGPAARPGPGAPAARSGPGATAARSGPAGRAAATAPSTARTAAGGAAGRVTRSMTAAGAAVGRGTRTLTAPAAVPPPGRLARHQPPPQAETRPGRAIKAAVVPTRPAGRRGRRPAALAPPPNIVLEPIPEPEPGLTASVATAEPEPGLTASVATAEPEGATAAAPADDGAHPPQVSFAPDGHTFTAPGGLEAFQFLTPGKPAHAKYRKTPRRPKRPLDETDSGESTPASSASEAARSVASAMAQFRHLVDSPWITTHRGSSSKRRRAQLESERRSQTQPLTMEDLPEPGVELNLEPAAVSAVSTTSSAEAPGASDAAIDNAKDNAAAPAESELSIKYFRGLLASETRRLEAAASRWEAVVSELESQSDAGASGDALGEIRTTTGQARLLVRERFDQFEGLVDNCEFLCGPRRTTLTDLQGFWEMIYFQVQDVDSKFAGLARLQAAGWQETAPAPAAVKPTQTKRPPAAGRRPAAKTKKAAPSSALRAAMMAARKKLQGSATSELAVEIVAPPPPSAAVDDVQAPAAVAAAATEASHWEGAAAAGGSFSVITPNRLSTATAQDSAARQRQADLRRSALLAQVANRRRSDLTPLARVTAAAKLAQSRGDSLTTASAGPERSASPQLRRSGAADDAPVPGCTTPAAERGAAAEAASVSSGLTAEIAVLGLKTRLSRRLVAPLSELDDNAQEVSRRGPKVRASRRAPSLLGPLAPASPLPAALGEDLILFDSPRRSSRRLAAAAPAR